MCGGTVERPLVGASGGGLSPRVRGNLAQVAAKPCTGRSIPACAGEPPSRPQRRHRRMVYPRVCGGTQSRSSSMMALTGLSPRVRGNQAVRQHAGRVIRSIPACAGEPGPARYLRCKSAVYPRVCGGTRIDAVQPGLAANPAAPRFHGADLEQLQRSIPACAGEPGEIAAARVGLRVYPRVCGGTWMSYSLASPPRGLSPRVRGNPGGRGQLPGRPGSIPACAGEPTGVPVRLSGVAVYPRVCGGTRIDAVQPGLAGGLSPRVRGNHAPRQDEQHGTGSIPACAGEPSSVHTPVRMARVYPRVCGGTVQMPPQAPLRRGLSPRVRGNRTT